MILSSVAVGAGTIAAEEHQAHHREIALSPELLKVLRAEMQEISTGVQRLALALATADWKGIQETSDNIRKSYVMEKKLTPEQTEELEHVLPERFKKLDAEFHQRAAKLGAAASVHDAELVTFHYSRLVESCVQCHIAYAQSRFPGFVAPVQQEHHHH
jgi:cytochrome c556